MSRVAVLLLVSATLAVAAPPTARSSAQTPSLTVTPSTGLVGGEVVTLDGSGFSGSTTVSFCEGIVTGSAPSASDCGTPIHSVGTDPTGAFSVSFSVFRFITQAGTVFDCAQPTSHCGFGASEVLPEAAITPITFAPQAFATPRIAGVVTGPGGNAVSNADVWAYTRTDSFVGSFRAVTNASGAYELTTATNAGVFSDSWSLRLAAPASPDLVAEWFDNQTNRVTSRVFLPQNFNDPQLTLTADAQLAAGGAIAGTVTDAGGAGVSNLRVLAYGPNDGEIATYAATTAADGSYDIPRVRADGYKVLFLTSNGSGFAFHWYNGTTRANAASVTVTAGSTTTGIDAQLGP